MSSLLRGQPRDQWSVEDAALFAATRDFQLLRLLSTDKKALATARRLGGSWAKPLATQNRTHTPAAQRAAGGDAPTQAATPREGNSRQRRSAKRATARHKKQRQAKASIHGKVDEECVLFVLDELLVEAGPAEVRPPQRRLYQSPVPYYAITCRSKVLACQLRNMYTWILNLVFNL